MSKVRVYELARDLNIETKMLVNRIKGMGIDIASHQSSLSDAQVEQIKVELKGGTTTAPAQAAVAAAAATAAQKPTVIRRRRVEQAPEAETAAEAATPAQDIQETRAPAATAAAEPPTSVIEEKSVEVVARKSVEETSPEPGRAQPAEVDARRSESAPAKEDVRQGRPYAGGATIVRRATPAELEAQQRAREARGPRDGRGPRDVQNRDARDQQRGDVRKPPMKRPGFVGEDKGLRTFRVEEDPNKQVPPAAPGEEWRDATKRPEKRVFASAEEEEKAKRLVPKQKRSQMSTRSLLQSFSENEEETEEVAPVEAEEAPRRTVYMPTASNKKRDIKRRKDLKKTQITTPRAAYRVVKMGNDITLGELGRQLGVKAGDLIKKLMTQGIMATINQAIDFDTATLLSGDYGFEVQSNLVSADDILKKSKAHADAETKSANLETRPPIVTIMGHVDHGKTSILDAIRTSKVAAGEAGGITQHIGAYTVEKNGKTIAFLDTPGHEAFSAMRSRGTEVTDIVILVVAADDGVMPQTVEAISHARAGNVPLIVAINKIDKPNINLDRVYTELMEHGIQSEEWGGETQVVKVSAMTGQGIDDLLENINLLAEVLDLKASAEAPMQGVVVEAHLDKGRGPVATVMVQNGSLRTGDLVVAGAVTGKVRFMTNHRGERQDYAGPSTPVEVIGLSEVPRAGDRVHAVNDERVARELAEFHAKAIAMENQGKSSAATLEQLLSRVQVQDTPEVPVILKADTQGSVEAIAEALNKINTEKVRNRVVHKAVGGVSESDITLAKASGAILIAFNVRAGRGLDEVAEKQGVPLRYFSVIYDLVAAVKNVMAGKLPPIVTEVIQGHAEVRQTIRVPKIGLVAGTAVVDGKITRNSHLRLIRDNVVIYSGKITSLRRFKDDVKEVAQGYECGIGIEGYQDIREGDVIESYVMQEEAPTL